MTLSRALYCVHEDDIPCRPIKEKGSRTHVTNYMNESFITLKFPYLLHYGSLHLVSLIYVVYMIKIIYLKYISYIKYYV